MKSTCGCHSHLNKHIQDCTKVKWIPSHKTSLEWLHCLWLREWYKAAVCLKTTTTILILQITAEFIVIDFVENLNKTLMGLDGQLVRLATTMNFHSLLNYHATCTLMLPKSKLFFFTENRTSRVEKNRTKIRMKIVCKHWLFKRWMALSTGEITIDWIVQLVSLILIWRIAIYPMDTAIHFLNNWACSLNLILWKLRFKFYQKMR